MALGGLTPSFAPFKSRVKNELAKIKKERINREGATPHLLVITTILCLQKLTESG
jgi:hypothetical protein